MSEEKLSDKYHLNYQSLKLVIVHKTIYIYIKKKKMVPFSLSSCVKIVILY